MKPFLYGVLSSSVAWGLAHPYPAILAVAFLSGAVIGLGLSMLVQVTEDKPCP